MLYLKFCLILAYFTLSHAGFTIHTTPTAQKSSDNSNIINLQPLDDTVFDIRYQTGCTDCQCFVNVPLLTYESIKDQAFNNEIIQSYMSSGKVYLLHKSRNNDISYSIYDTNQADTLTELIKEAALPSYSGFDHIHFGSGINAFVGYSEESVVINTIDDEGKAQEKSYTLGEDQKLPSKAEVFDVAYAQGLVFLALGENGIQVLKVKDGSNDLDGSVLGLQDLEVKEEFKAMKLEIDAKNNLLYIYDPESDSDLIVVLDFTNKDELSIVGSFDFDINQVSQLVITSGKFHVINHETDKCFYNEFLTRDEDKYNNPKMIKLWEIPSKVRTMECNGDNILIDTEEVLYIFRKDLPYEAHTAELLVDIVQKKGASRFFPILQDKKTYLLAVDSSEITLSAVQERPELFLQCGISKTDYASTASFSLNLYKDSCPDAPNKADDNACLEQLSYDVDFVGDKYTEPEPNAMVPSPVRLFNSDNLTGNGTVSSNHSGHGGHTVSNHTQKNNKTSPKDNDPIITVKKPDLIDPDAPYYDRLNDTYALIIVGVIIFTCFGCLVKCLYDFVKSSKARIARQFEHKQLEEEESGSEESGDEESKEGRKAAPKKKVANKDEDVSEEL